MEGSQTAEYSQNAPLLSALAILLAACVLSSTIGCGGSGNDDDVPTGPGPAGGSSAAALRRGIAEVSTLFARDFRAGALRPGVASIGRELYRRKCSQCHGLIGTMRAAAWGPLGGEVIEGPWILARDWDKGADEARTIVTFGKGRMPPFRNVLTRQQILDIVSYLRVAKAEQRAADEREARRREAGGGGGSADQPDDLGEGGEEPEGE